ncbi:MAG: type 1 glutamine amidotransferase [Bdellovibrionales bacterium]|nr:type 1 glutamine amidotransferase [Bdellovibrionales bacterium]
MDNIKDLNIAILATNGFEHSELFIPKKKIEDAGGKATIVSLDSGSIKSWKDGNWGKTVKVDKLVSEVTSDDFDGLVLPGGVINPDLLRDNEKAVNFVKDFFMEKKQKPVAAICHGPWMLVEADVVKGRTLTSYSSIKTDLINAGANWTDEEVVVDKGLVTSRSPADMEAFIDKMLEEFKEGTHRLRSRTRTSEQETSMLH